MNVEKSLLAFDQSPEDCLSPVYCISVCRLTASCFRVLINTSLFSNILLTRCDYQDYRMLCLPKWGMHRRGGSCGSLAGSPDHRGVFRHQYRCDGAQIPL